MFYPRYSWCSKRLIKNESTTDKVRLGDMIPMETCVGQHHAPDGRWKPKIVIGHNVGFDRSFIKEQYYIKVNCLKLFLNSILALPSILSTNLVLA